MNIRYLVAAGIGLAITLLHGGPLLAADAASALDIGDPYVREVPPGQPNSAAFMTFTNETEDARALVSASSPAADTVELHTHVNEGGVMKMRQVERIEFPANATAVLEPGGLHIMLMGLKVGLVEGEDVSIKLQFEDGSKRSLEAPVRKLKMHMEGGAHGHGEAGGQQKN